MRIIGHAGLAAGRPAGTPDEATLREAGRLALDRLEVDLWGTADGRLVLRHDARLGGGPSVEAATLAQLRAAPFPPLTLDEALEIVGGSPPLLLDLKGTAVVEALARWGRVRPDDGTAVCTDDRAALRRLRDAAPQMPRWLTLPEVGAGVDERRRRITAALLRALLPAQLPGRAAEVGAAALCVDHWATTRALCRAAHRLDLPVAAWTVNGPHVARRVARTGVDMVTTDRPLAVRAAICGSRDGMYRPMHGV